MFLTKVALGGVNTAITTFTKGDIVYQVSGVTGGTFSAQTYTGVVAGFVEGATDYLYVSDETGTLLSGASTQTIIRKDGMVNYYVVSKEVTNINVTKDPKILESSGDNMQLDLLRNDDDLFDFSEVDPFSEGKY